MMAVEHNQLPIETMPGVMQARASTIDALTAALEKPGVVFVEPSGYGPGVRLKK